MTQQILNDAVHKIGLENNAATTIKSILSGHKGRKAFKFQKDEYPAIVARRRAQVSTMQPSTSLQTVPITLTPSQQSSQTASRTRARQLYEQALQQHSPTSQLQSESNINRNDVEAALDSTAQSVARYRKKVDAAIKIQKVERQRQAIKKDK